LRIACERGAVGGRGLLEAPDRLERESDRAVAAAQLRVDRQRAAKERHALVYRAVSTRSLPRFASAIA
jgi:hypothetical protein